MDGALSYTWEISDPNKGKYDIRYYINLARDLGDMGVHSLAAKDMAGLLTTCAATILILALGEELPEIILNVDTHET